MRFATKNRTQTLRLHKKQSIATSNPQITDDKYVFSGISFLIANVASIEEQNTRAPRIVLVLRDMTMQD